MNSSILINSQLALMAISNIFDISYSIIHRIGRRRLAIESPSWEKQYLIYSRNRCSFLFTIGVGEICHLVNRLTIVDTKIKTECLGTSLESDCETSRRKWKFLTTSISLVILAMRVLALLRRWRWWTLWIGGISGGTLPWHTGSYRKRGSVNRKIFPWGK
jgi:hypothetical protein